MLTFAAMAKSLDKVRPVLYLKTELWEDFKVLAEIVEGRSANDTAVRLIAAFVEANRDQLPQKPGKES